jgi:hypothetical protein
MKGILIIITSNKKIIINPSAIKNRKVAVMQPYFFPYAGYFQLLSAADKFILLNDVNFIKRGWINRNYILVNNCRSLFTIPVKKSSQNTLIKDIMIFYETDWDKKLLTTIKRSYKKAPNFKEVFEILSKILSCKEKYLYDLILQSLSETTRYLGIRTEISESSDNYLNSDLKGEERLIDICLKEKAEQYINPSGGVELYSKDNFNRRGIKLNFLKSKEFIYRQFDNKFESSLSMIDIMMFNPKEKILEFLNEYELI